MRKVVVNFSCSRVGKWVMIRANFDKLSKKLSLMMEMLGGGWLFI